MKKKNIKKKTKKDLFKNGKNDKKPCGGAIYFFGFIGAIIYYIQTATTFGQGVLGVLKAFVWPVFLVYELLSSIGA